MSLAGELDRRGLDWIVPDWPAPATVRALMTTRNGGFSTGACRSMNLGLRGDDKLNVSRNQELLRAVCGVEPLWLSQTHGTQVVAVEQAQRLVEGDAAVATRPGRAAAVRVADCLPVLFCDRRGTRVAAAHAGWRGLCAGVLEATIAAMGTPSQEIIAWLGPAIGPGAFEVGDEVREAFVSQNTGADAGFVPYPGRPGKWLADLYALARSRLRNVGIVEVHGGGFCTATDADRFFSYRRDKTPARMAALVWLAAPA
jgi:polyphenol oxidase